MITITMPEWFAISLVIYFVLDTIARIIKLALNEIENKRSRDYRQYMRELIARERERRDIREWKEWKERQ